MSGETTVGGLVGFLKIDADQANRTLDRIIARLDRLDVQDANVDIDVNTGAAEAKIAGLEAQLQALGDRNSIGSGRGIGALATAVIALGPALVPLSVAAVGLGAAFAGMGSVALPAIFGIKNEMDEGTAVGQGFRAGIDQLKGSFDVLGKTVAGNLLAPFQQTVTFLNGELPQLNSFMSDMSTIAGKAGVNVVTGLVSGFMQLRPLMQDTSVYVLNLTNRFSELMSGSGVTAFGDYVRSVFPQVVQQVESIIGAAIRLVAALAPLGGGILTAIGELADVINAIPVDVLSVIATTASAVFLGFRSWQALSGIIQPIAGALQAVGVSAEGAATAIRAMSIAAGAIGIVVTALTIAFTMQAEKARENQQAIDDYADALKRSSGAIDDNVRALATQKLQQSGVLDTARDLGYSLKDVADAATGNADAISRVNDHTAALQNTTATTTKYQNDQVAALLGQRDAFGQNAQVLLDNTGKQADQQVAIDKVTGAIGTNNSQLSAANQQYQDYAAATDAARASLAGVTTEQWAAAGALQATAPAIVAAQEATDKHAASASQATLQMQLEGDAAGLLKQALDALNGVTLNVEQSVTREASARQSATKTLTENKASMDLNTDAGVANRGALEQAAVAAQAHAEAVAKQTGSTQAGTQALGASKTALENVLRATGNLTPAVQAYIDKLYAVPPVVQTKVEADTALAQQRIAAVVATLNSLHDRTVTVTTQNQTIDSGAYAGKQVGVGQAFGGLWRNGVQAMAAGGMARDSGITSKPILWGEAGTEAYINLTKPGARSTSILAAANQALGNPLGPNVTVYVQSPITGEWVRSEAQVVVDDALAGTTQALRAGVRG